MNPIGVHFLPTHTGQFHYDFIRDMQPGIFKLVGSSTPDVQQMADGYAAAPNAIHYWRNVARSEQHDFLWREPVRAAQQHVTEWHADIQQRYQQARERGLTLPPVEQIRILGVNEPVIELFPRNEDMSNYDEWLAMMNERTPLLDAYMVTFGYEANRLGYGAGLGNISSGQPANKKPGEYATFDWFPKTRKLLESTRGKNAYVCHEYWRAETGPEGHADWHAWRFMHLNVNCDIDILESGVDQKITSQQPLDPRGWHGHMSAAAYVDQHRRYIARARTDSRFRCETPFTLDGDKMWESFWVEYCMKEMVALSNEVRTSTPKPPQSPIDPDRPSHNGAMVWPVRGPVTQRFGEPPARFGQAGHDGIDIGVALGSPVGAVYDGEVMFTGFDDAYGNYVRVYHAALHSHSFYAHLSKISCTVGQRVDRGQTIGLSGSTGNSTGPHLHLEMRGGTRDGYLDVTFGYSKGRYDPVAAYLLTGSPLAPRN